MISVGAKKKEVGCNQSRRRLATIKVLSWFILPLNSRQSSKQQLFCMPGKMLKIRILLFGSWDNLAHTALGTQKSKFISGPLHEHSLGKWKLTNGLKCDQYCNHHGCQGDSGLWSWHWIAIVVMTSVICNDTCRRRLHSFVYICSLKLPRCQVLECQVLERRSCLQSWTQSFKQRRRPRRGAVPTSNWQSNLIFHFRFQKQTNKTKTK